MPGNLYAMSEENPDWRPVTDRGRATRDRIVSCAAELLVMEGVSGVSLDRVRQAASVSGSQLTHYFADKSALIRAVIARQTEVMLDFHRQPVLRNLDTMEDFEKWVELTLVFSKRRVRYQALPTYGMLAGQLSKYDEPTRELLADGYQRWGALLRSGLARMKRNGLLSDTADLTALTNVLISAHEGGNLMTGAYGKVWPDRDALSFALAHLRQFATSPGTSKNPSPAGRRGRQIVDTHRPTKSDVS
jgi:AcrR family transcriptional regulator